MAPISREDKIILEDVLRIIRELGHNLITCTHGCTKVPSQTMPGLRIENYCCEHTGCEATLIHFYSTGELFVEKDHLCGLYPAPSALAPCIGKVPIVEISNPANLLPEHKTKQ